MYKPETFYHVIIFNIYHFPLPQNTDTISTKGYKEIDHLQERKKAQDSSDKRTEQTQTWKCQNQVPVRFRPVCFVSRVLHLQHVTYLLSCSEFWLDSSAAGPSWWFQKSVLTRPWSFHYKALLCWTQKSPVKSYTRLCSLSGNCVLFC